MVRSRDGYPHHAGQERHFGRGVGMVFSSIVFLFRFLPVFMTLYFVTYFFPDRAARWMRNIILFLGSLVFYAWGEPVYVLLMLFSTVSDYLHGRAIENCKGRTAARCLLVSSICINLFVLGFFKYADFLIDTVNALAGTAIPLLKLGLPIGISFYTFQTMSYTIDVYRGKAKVQHNILDFGVFVTLFPQLIAGPIVKYTDVENDLRDRKADIVQISYGCRRFVTGLAKKVLLANNIGMLWEEISAMDYGSMSVLAAWMGIVAFALQIFFDFSGYSDMAIGLGAILGFRFPENFNYPYISSSITEFWRRWHISLGSWFREYVYIPLGGNRKGLPRQLFNILVVWMLTGIWHGAGWNFLLWGLWFALFLVLEKAFLGKVLKALPRIFGWAYSIFVVLIGWVLFQVEKTDAIVAYLCAMFGQGRGAWYDDRALYLLLQYAVILVLAVISATPFVKKLGEALYSSGDGIAIALRRLLQKVIPALLLLLSIAYIVDASYNPFLYFRF